jgi:hypothetical protein
LDDVALFEVRSDFRFGEMLPLLCFDQIFPTMYRIERRELTEQRTHGAAMLNIFHCNSPRFIFTGYSGSLRQSHYDYAKEQFFAGLEHLELPREITETALANAIDDKAENASRRSDALEK